MTINDRQFNMLSCLAQITLINKGPRAGQVKRRLDAYECYDGRTVSALWRRGLIDCRFDSVNGSGHAVTKAGWDLLADDDREFFTGWKPERTAS